MPRSPRSADPFAGRRIRAAVGGAGAIGRGSRPPVLARPAAGWVPAVREEVSA
ncbi:hypothetical protein ACIRBZ_33530 [Streptomyces sp. NPDC094038]|uniref:hypothetical protein n=1 Tax=Streptomyces sp. NPDC094038 TaxID=3366055 RepID=UPI00382378DF